MTDHDRRSTQREAAYLGFLTGSYGLQCFGFPPGKCSVGSDTEEVTGSNPVAPTTVLAGQRAISSQRTALLTDRGRAAAADCSPPNRMGAPEPDDTGPPPAQRPRSVATPLGPGPRSAITPATCRGRLRGTFVHARSFPAPPANRPAPGAGPAALIGQPGEHGAAAGAPAKRRPRSAVDTRASHPRPTFDHPSRQARFGQRRPSHSPTTAIHRTWVHHTRPVPPQRRPGSSAMRTARLQRPRTPDAWLSGHPGSHRTRGHRSPGHRTSARPVGRTSAWRTADADRATNGVAGVRTPSAATTIATAGWAAQTSLGLQRLRCSAADDRSAYDTPAAAVPGQLRSTARHEAAPRRTAVVCWSWRVRGEGNGTTER
jgi:hypothetical protein